MITKHKVYKLHFLSDIMGNLSIVISMYNAKPATIEVVDRLLMPSLINNLDSGKQLILLNDASPLKLETRAMIEKYRLDLERKLGDFQYHENIQKV